MVLEFFYMLSSLAPVFMSFATLLFLMQSQNRQWEREERLVRLDILRRIFGNRHRLTNNLTSENEPFIALNESWIVYAKYPNVLNALSQMHREIQVKGRLVPNIIFVMKEMAKATNTPIDEIPHDVYERPFAPPSPSPSSVTPESL